MWRALNSLAELKMAACWENLVTVFQAVLRQSLQHRPSSPQQGRLDVPLEGIYLN